MIEYVHIKQATADHPVYHKGGYARWGNDCWNHAKPNIDPFNMWVTEWYERMLCGVKLPLTATFIQRDRADLIARPCERCFPGT